MYDSIIILGATASGKTAVSIELAKRLGAEIVNADSMYIYRDFDIGTAKPSTMEMGGIKHHLISFVDPLSDFSVADYRQNAKNAIEDILNKNIVPIIVGGTGFYIDSLINTFSYGGDKDSKLRAELESELESCGKDYLYSRLCKLDSETAKKLHPNDVKRIIRAIEICLTSKTKKSEIENNCDAILKNPLIVGLNVDRDALYSRINLRVDKMIEAGLIDEVKALVAKGYTPDNCNAMKGIGYKEIYSYLIGETPLEFAIEKVKQHTRNYAKRQITWFKRNDKIIWMTPSCDFVDKILKLFER